MNWAPNLVVHQVFPCSARGPYPWEWETRPSVECRESKVARHEWITQTGTRHHVWSAVEGVNPNCRVAKARGDSEGNPPRKIHAFVADFDARFTSAELEGAVKRIDCKPNWVETTSSDNVRAVWLFAVPVAVADFDMAAAFLRAAKTRLAISSAFAALDEGATVDPARRWINGGKWTKIHDAPIPEEQLRLWTMDVLRERNSEKKKFCITIPLDHVADALRGKYPSFAEWPGEFEEGSMGPTFWIDGSASPKSASVHCDGIYTFSAHAGKPFYSWEDLLGREFVREYGGQKMLEAIDDIYFDGVYWWRKVLRPDAEEIWQGTNKDVIVASLKTDRGLTTKKMPGSGGTEIDCAVNYIASNRVIEGAGPFPCRREQFVTINGRMFLNTYDMRKMVQPAPYPCKWEDIPFINDLLHNFLIDENAFRRYMHWWAFFVKSCYAGNPLPGTALVIVGPPDIGKTFVQRYVCAPTVGGFADVGRCLSEGGRFDKHHFENLLWVVDDTMINRDAESHRMFSEKVKAFVANREHSSEQKFEKAVMLEFNGRIVQTLNSDPKSLAALPQTDNSSEDKFLMLRSATEKNERFRAAPNKLDIIKEELPRLVRLLLDYPSTPEDLRCPRFGTKGWQDPELLAMSRHSDDNSGFVEMINDFRESLFRDKPDGSVWSGSAAVISRALAAYGFSEARVSYVRRGLAKMAAEGRIEFKDSGATRIFTLKK